MIKRVVNIARSQEEAREWDIRQALEMTHEERQKVARVLKERVYGENNPDVREWHQSKRQENTR